MYECTSCGAQMRYDPNKRKLVCNYCKNTLPIADHPDEMRFREGKAEEAEASGYDVTIFSCPQCGGEIMSLENQAADFCTYCGASVTLQGRLSNTDYPERILPFRVSKKEIQDHYKYYVKSLHFVPKELKSEEVQEKFCGIYMPFWSYKVSQKGHAMLHGQRVVGDATEYCVINMDLDTVYDDICFDASSSFDDYLSNAINPFDMEDVEDFSPAYMLGFYADTSDVDSHIYEEDAKKEANRKTTDKISQADKNIGNMTITDPEDDLDELLHTKVQSCRPVLLPVWFLAWRTRGRKGERVAYAVANGKSMKMRAEVPLDLKQCLLLACLITIPLTGVLFLGLPALMPATAMILSACLLIFTTSLYQKHMSELFRRETHLDDLGYLSRKNPKKKDQVRRKKRKKTSRLVTVVTLILLFVFYVLIEIVFSDGGLYVLGKMFTALINHSAVILALAGLAGLIRDIRGTRSLFRLKPDKETVFYLIYTYGALAAVAVIYFRHPVSDLIYYVGMLLTLVGMLLLMYGLLARFNLLCSHAVPDFLDRREAK